MKRKLHCLDFAINRQPMYSQTVAYSEVCMMVLSPLLRIYDKILAVSDSSVNLFINDSLVNVH